MPTKQSFPLSSLEKLELLWLAAHLFNTWNQASKLFEQILLRKMPDEQMRESLDKLRTLSFSDNPDRISTPLGQERLEIRKELERISTDIAAHENFLRERPRAAVTAALSLVGLLTMPVAYDYEINYRDKLDQSIDAGLEAARKEMTRRVSMQNCDIPSALKTSSQYNYGAEGGLKLPWIGALFKTSGQMTVRPMGEPTIKFNPQNYEIRSIRIHLILEDKQNSLQDEAIYDYPERCLRAFVVGRAPNQ